MLVTPLLDWHVVNVPDARVLVVAMRTALHPQLFDQDSQPIQLLLRWRGLVT